jgi:uncharacterized membrane protein YkvA (DUF1232 family)
MRRPPSLERLHGESPLPEAPSWSPEQFWTKLRTQALRAGRALVERALWLYYAAEREDTPRWARLTVYGALAYFILPVDAVPDFLPGAGYVDDMGVLGAALLTVAQHVDDAVKGLARERMREWFGPELIRPGE